MSEWKISALQCSGGILRHILTFTQWLRDTPLEYLADIDDTHSVGTAEDSEADCTTTYNTVISPTTSPSGMPLVSSTILPMPVCIIPTMISFSTSVDELAIRLNQFFLLRVSPRVESNHQRPSDWD
jgi:hypothetical protein